MVDDLADEALWAEIEKTAVRAGLDPAKFGAVHREIAGRIAAFLQEEPPPKAEDENRWRGWLNGFTLRQEEEPEDSEPVRPIIIVGEPGTGKTTFLYVLDTVFRRHFDLPDMLAPHMAGRQGRTHPVAKRSFLGRPISLLSVRQWTELLHFFGWDIEHHRFDRRAQTRFIDEVLRPMRVVFADEVEMTGYSPTIPDLAARGILVVGTSNQTQFKQLESEAIPAHIFHFEGNDMRFGDPADATVGPADPARRLFDELRDQKPVHFGPLPYRRDVVRWTVYVYLNFETTLKIPFLESQWVDFFNAAFRGALGGDRPLQPDDQLIILLDHFSLEELRTNFDGIIRFVSLFDAIEQLCLGVLVGHPDREPELSREALQHMKVTINAARGVSDDIKKKTVVGVDRMASRLGQAAHRAREQTTDHRPQTSDD